MAESYIICNLPKQILERALDSVKRGEAYTIHLQAEFVPDEICDTTAIEPTIEIPHEEIDRIARGRPLSEKEINTIKGEKE